MMEFFGWLETPATAAGPVVNHTRFCRWGVSTKLVSRIAHVVLGSNRRHG